MKHAVVILPTYNERNNIQTIIPKIFEASQGLHKWKLSVLVVDDNSPDGTAGEVVKLQATYPELHIIHGEKKGLGNAYIRGFSHALDNLNPTVIFEMDADMSHDPALITLFLTDIDDGADFVIGSRYIRGGSIPSDWGLHRKIFSYCGNIILRLGFMNLKIHEWTNGFRAIKAGFIKSILSELTPFNGYVFQIAILDRAIKKNLDIREIPMHFKERKSGESKISSLRYIFDIFVYILQNSSFVKFCIVGLIGFIINVIGLEVFYHAGFTPGIAAAIGAEFAIISNFLLNNAWSFSHKKISSSEKLISKFLQFNIVSFGSIVIQFIIVGIGTHIFGDSTRLFFLVVAIFFFIIPYSYIMYNHFIWKKNHR